MIHSLFARDAARVVCGATAVLAVAGCADTVNQRFFCSIEDVQLGGVCLAWDEADDLSLAACKHLCEEFVEGVPPGDTTPYDCDQVSVENATHSFPSVCEIDIDWADVILDDPDSGLIRSYTCTAPWAANQYYCPWDVDGDGEGENGIETGEGTYLGESWFQGCGIDSTAGHQSCIDNCADILASVNADLAAVGADCSFPVFLCDGLNFPVEQEGQVCDASGMVFDRAGDRAEKLMWSTASGGGVARPLACSLSGDCCEAFGPMTCSNLRLGTREFIAADDTTSIAGTVKFVSGIPGVAPVVVAVSGVVRSSSSACVNSAGTCPLYLEDLQLQFPQYISGIVFNGAQYHLRNLSATLEAPTLGVAEMGTGAVKLLGDRASLRLAATAYVPAQGVSLRVDETPALPAAIDARIDRHGQLVELTTSVALPGTDATILIELASPASPNRGAR